MGARTLAWIFAGLAVTVAACRSAQGTRTLVLEPKIAGDEGRFPAGVARLDVADGCALHYQARGGTQDPLWVRTDRDLDADGRDDVAVADWHGCDELGNCQWQLYRVGAADQPVGACPTFVGVVAGATLAVVPGDERPMRLQGLWRLPEGRLLRQEYRFEAGLYQLQGASVCAQEGVHIVCGASAP